MPKEKFKPHSEQLRRAAKAACRAFTKFGPTDDGTKAGKALEDAMVDLAVHARLLPKPLVIYYRRVRTPGGRGRNATHWEAMITPPTDSPFDWLQAKRGPSDASAVGQVLLAHYNYSADRYITTVELKNCTK